jgi:hypothetical protein
VDPAVDADLVAFGDHAPLLIGMEQCHDGRHEKARLHIAAGQDIQDARNALAIAVLALRQFADRFAAVTQLVRFMVRVE